MEFGALANPALMDRPEFQARMILPPDPIHTRERLGWLKANQKPADQKVLTGCPVWNNPSWPGSLYPAGTTTKNALGHYAKKFQTVELNSTFYGIPELETVLRWKTEAGSPFLFCPKIPKIISHDRMLKECLEITRVFQERMGHLEKSLGPAWLQLPPGFSPDRLPALKNWIENAWDRNQALAVEFRHPGWFLDSMLIPEATEILEKNKVATVITDTPGRREVLHLTLTANWVFIRFTGNERHAYDRKRLDDWAKKLEGWLESGIRRILFFVHEPSEEKIPETVNDFIHRINPVISKYGSSLTPWSHWQPEQPTLF
ncbi:MAG: DUF72 domain-containing protein [Bdellovibrionales bacterium]|nr:DUF72 domain-containing protein [Bdellovibrionales bacterium]